LSKKGKAEAEEKIKTKTEDKFKTEKKGEPEALLLEYS